MRVRCCCGEGDAIVPAMTNIQDISSGVSNHDNTTNDKFRDTFDAIGRADEGAAASISGQKSSVALLKGILSGLGLPTGSGGAAVNGNPNILDDGMAAIGTQADPPATDVTGAWSAVSLAKGVLSNAGFV